MPSTTGKQRYAVAIRDFEPEDYAAIVEIGNLLYPEHRDTVEEVRHWDETFDRDRYVRQRHVATDPATGAVVASGVFSHMPWAFHPQKFQMWLGVHPDRQRRGIGRAMYEHILAALRTRDALSVKSGARENMEASVAFLARRGFREVMRNWESRLDLASFDASRFADRARLPLGIGVVTLAQEIARDPETLRKTYDLVNAVAPDAPRVDPFTPASFEMFRDELLDSPGALPEAYFLAKEGGAYVGQTSLARSEAMRDELFTGFTGVRREHRGRGIAFALKLRAVDYARRNGYRRIRTWNSTLNAEMLGINVELGFVKQPAWITYEKDLASEAR